MMTALKEGISARLMAASPLRAGLEMAALGVVLLLALVLFVPQLPPEELQNSAFIVLLIVSSLYALRLRRFAGPWHRGLLRLIALGGLPALVVCWGLLWLSFRLYVAILIPPGPGLLGIVSLVLLLDPRIEAATSVSQLTPMLALAMLFSCQVAFYSMRGLARIWLFWRRLQRQHLIWSITNSHLTFVFLGSFLFAALIVISAMGTFEPSALASLRFVNNLVPLVIIVAVMMLGTLVGVLPPAVVIAYFTARLTTRRIKQLAEATSAMRAGDYSVRMTVRGEDEIASLQTDFNAMAEALEESMQALQEERDAVTHLLESRRQLMASVSHELRTPVAILYGHLESAQARWEADLPANLAHDIDVMLDETRHLQRLIDDLFTLSRAEVDRLELRLQRLDAGSVIQHVVDATSSIYWQTQRVQVVAAVESDLPPVLVDRVRLEQVIHNLVRNGVRHTPPGGIVAVSACASPEGVILQVKDTGEGIAAEDLPHIWERFYRSTTARQEDNRGAGLGLALVRDLVEAMHGTVAVESQAGQGSCFSVNLPRAS